MEFCPRVNNSFWDNMSEYLCLKDCAAACLYIGHNRSNMFMSQWHQKFNIMQYTLIIWQVTFNEVFFSESVFGIFM